MNKGLFHLLHPTLWFGCWLVGWIGASGGWNTQLGKVLIFDGGMCLCK